MLFEEFLRFLFVIYCTTVGVLLLLAPWTPGWDHMLTHLPFTPIKILGLPAARGAISGFGLVHLVFSLHDLTALLNPNLPSHESERS